MKKSLIATALIIGGFATSAVSADDGQINFVGEITDAACTIVNDMANPLEVTLGTVSRTSLDGAAGKTAAPTAFNIQLENCPPALEGAAAQVKFDGLSANGDNTALALTADTDVATGVGVQISDSQNKVVPLFTSSSAYTLTAGDNNLPFVARYLAIADVVTAGPANSTTNFTIVYN
ncbi:MAG: fimbrial protein [Klebsiella huaxiensis]|uniref:fimbrial protein n=1 Tax=Klebsiella huaxiensis TaxID=2153354 RepID=UPI0026F0A244|nr:fimbrial protein [Klebsiella huaxiensis]WEJ88816.1 MAG: fimbrial protein [Klebsiella huaxiensis]